jgi:lysophospholipase L1-like esterase
LKNKPIRNLLIWSGVIVILILLILIGIEVYLRLTETHIIKTEEGGGILSVELDAEFLVEYTPRGRRLIPNSRVLIKNHRISGRDITMEINSLGFRDDELSPEKGSDELRILILGDSITWASYLQAEETFVERAEEYLRQSLPAHSVEVINAGVGDIGLKEEIDILEERGLEARPDLVVVSFYLNDSRPPWGFPGELGSRGWLRRHSLLAETIYKNLKLRSFIKEEGEDRLAWASPMNKMNWAGDRNTFLKLAALARYDWGAAWEENSWGVIDRELDRLKELSLKHGFEVAIVAFPVAFQVYADFVEDTPQQRIKQAVGERDFSFLDLLPYLRDYRKTHKDIYLDWCHPAAKTNDLIGNIIADFLFRDFPDLHREKSETVEKFRKI